MALIPKSIKLQIRQSIPVIPLSLQQVVKVLRQLIEVYNSTVVITSTAMRNQTGSHYQVSVQSSEMINALNSHMLRMTFRALITGLFLATDRQPSSSSMTPSRGFLKSTKANPTCSRIPNNSILFQKVKVCLNLLLTSSISVLFISLSFPAGSSRRYESVYL